MSMNETNNNQTDIFKDVGAVDNNIHLLIRSLLKFIDDNIDEESNKFSKLLFSFVVNDCLLHLIVLDLCIQDSAQETYLQRHECEKYKKIISTQVLQCMPLTLSILTSLIIKMEKQTLSEYHAIYRRLYKFILSSLSSSC